MPFWEDTLVFKVEGKIFCLTGIDTFAFINVKCDPDKAVLLREQYAVVTPGYHMNKKHCPEGIPSGEQRTNGWFGSRQAGKAVD